MISGILFDFDGIIVDSERLHWKAFNVVFKLQSLTVSWGQYLEYYVGFDDRGTFRYALPNIDDGELKKLIAQKAAAFQKVLRDEGATALPGSVDLIKHLSGRLPLAICSGALHEDIDPIIGSLGIAEAFDTIVTADETHISKPDPAPYRLAMQQLGVTGGLAIEDTPAGIASAKGAGLQVLAVTNSYEREFLTEADVVVDSLEGLTLEKLNAFPI